MIRILLGAAIGAVLGVLFAPRPGAETRAELRQRMDGAYGTGGLNAQSAGEDIRQRLEEARAKVSELVSKVDETIRTASQPATAESPAAAPSEKPQASPQADAPADRP